jgi:hypothetical protein
VATIEKRIWPGNFEEVLSGIKTYEPRLQDFEVAPGDILHLREWDPKTSTYTGREVKKKISEVFKLSPKELRKYWTQEQIERHGLQIIHFE